LKDWHVYEFAGLPSGQQPGTATGQVHPPKFSKACLVVRYNNKLQKVCPSLENISWLQPWLPSSTCPVKQHREMLLLGFTHWRHKRQVRNHCIHQSNT